LRHKKKSADKIRITLDLSPEFYKRLDELTNLVDAESKAQVIREALKLYEFVMTQSQEGATFSIRTADGREKDILLMS
jgi:plasmid maintenance system antidote protein VapI